MGENNERQSSFLSGSREQPQFSLPESPFASDPLLRDLKTVLLSRREWQKRPTRGTSLVLVDDLRNKEKTRTLIDPNQAWQKTPTSSSTHAGKNMEALSNQLEALIIITPPLNFFQMEKIKTLITSMIKPLKYKSPIAILEERAGLDLIEPLDPQSIRKQLQILGTVKSKTLTSKRVLGPLAETHRLTLTRAPAPRKKWPKEKDPLVSPAIAIALQEKFCLVEKPFRATPEHNIDLHPPTNEPGVVYKDSRGDFFVVTEVEIRPGEKQLAGIRELKPSERPSY